jgi:hypothetical protein
MILLEIFSETFTWRNLLQDINLFAQIIGVIMVIIYVIYTYKTFAQIKKQTDYQQDAFIKVEAEISQELRLEPAFRSISHGRAGLRTSQSNLFEKYLQKDISLKMKGILQPIFKLEDNLFDGNYFIVILTNYGNAEVNNINLTLSIDISNSIELVEKRMLRKSETIIRDISIQEIVGRSGGTLKIPIISTASFPIYKISIGGTYTDVRSKAYNIVPIIKEGKNEHFHKLP